MNQREEIHSCCYCLLDLTISSKLLSKIADIPHKHKHEQIIEPLFEYCFGTSFDDDYVWEDIEDEIIINDENNNNGLNIDWIRDRTFIYDIIMDLPFERIEIIAEKFGLWRKRDFVLNFIQCGGECEEIFNHLNDDFENDREIVMALIMEDGDSLKFINNEYRNDFEIVKIACQHSDGSAFKYASEELRNNKELAMIAIRYGDALEGASEALRDDKDVVLLALENGSYAYKLSSNRLKQDRDVIFKAFSKSLSYIETASDLLRNDREFILMITKVDGFKAIQYASEEMRNDREIAIQAIQQNVMAIQHVSDELKNDREIGKMVVEQAGHCLVYLSSNMCDDEEIAQLAIESFPDAIHSISYRLRNNAEFISKAVGKIGFFDIPEEFIHDIDIILESIKIDAANFRHAPIELQNNREFIIQSVTINGLVLKYVNDEFSKDREIVLAAITENGHALPLSKYDWNNDMELIFNAAKNATDLYYFYNSFIKNRLRNDKQFIMQLVKLNGRYFVYIPKRYQMDREIVLHALVETNPQAIFYHISRKLLATDRLIALRIAKQYGDCLSEFCSKHRNDKEIVYWAVKQNKNV